MNSHLVYGVYLQLNTMASVTKHYHSPSSIKTPHQLATTHMRTLQLALNSIIQAFVDNDFANAHPLHSRSPTHRITLSLITTFATQLSPAAP